MHAFLISEGNVKNIIAFSVLHQPQNKMFRTISQENDNSMLWTTMLWSLSMMFSVNHAQFSVFQFQ